MEKLFLFLFFFPIRVCEEVYPKMSILNIDRLLSPNFSKSLDGIATGGSKFVLKVPSILFLQN